MNTVSEKIERILAGDSWSHKESIIHGFYPKLSRVDRETILYGASAISEPEGEWDPHLDYELQLRRYVGEEHLYGAYVDFTPTQKLELYMTVVESMYHPYATRKSICEELIEKLPVNRVLPSDEGFSSSLQFCLAMAEIAEEDD
jgi:hypothetical protein